MSLQTFDAETYWSQRTYKKWVVRLIKISGYNKPVDSDVKYVRAKTEEGAILTARFHTALTGRVSASFAKSRAVSETNEANLADLLYARLL